MDLSTDEITELEQLERQATPGPWKVESDYDPKFGSTADDPDGYFVGFKWNDSGWWDEDSTLMRKEDADFVAYSRNALPMIYYLIIGVLMVASIGVSIANVVQAEKNIRTINQMIEKLESGRR